MEQTKQTPIEKLKLSTGIHNILKRHRLDYIEQIVDMKMEDFMSLNRCGQAKAQEVILALSKFTTQHIMAQNEYSKLQEVVDLLKAIQERESKRHQMDEHLDPHTADAVLEVIGMLEDEIDYDPTPNEPGEPPMTMNEMHNAAWKEHQEMHR
jgi:hypothetical protein